MRRRVGLPLLLLSFAATTAMGDEPPPALDEQDPSALFREATDALAGDRPADAIAKLESLGDHGVLDPVVSYDRGLAYALRVRAGAEQPGDLGRAAHGFEEARALSADDALIDDATRALVAVRAEVARRRARAGDPVEVQHGVSLGRSIVGLLPENAWAMLGVAFSLVLAAAIATRARARAPRAKVAATTTSAISGALLAIAALLAWAARDARLHLREGIVIAPGARLLDERHLAKDGASALPEGARVRIVNEAGGYSRIEVGGESGDVSSSAVLPIAKR